MGLIEPRSMLEYGDVLQAKSLKLNKGKNALFYKLSIYEFSEVIENPKKIFDENIGAYRQF
jgi:hypothetical protein